MKSLLLMVMLSFVLLFGGTLPSGAISTSSSSSNECNVTCPTGFVLGSDCSCNVASSSSSSNLCPSGYYLSAETGGCVPLSSSSIAMSSSSVSSISITCPVGYIVITKCDSYGSSSSSGGSTLPGGTISCVSSHQECYNPCATGYFYATSNTCTLTGNAPSSTDVRVCPPDTNNNTPTPDFTNRCCPAFGAFLPGPSGSDGLGTIYYGSEQFSACPTSSSSSSQSNGGGLLPGPGGSVTCTSGYSLLCVQNTSSIGSSTGNLPGAFSILPTTCPIGYHQECVLTGTSSNSSSGTSDTPPEPGFIATLATKTLPLKTGWNLISVPMQTSTEFNLNLLLSGKATIAYKFNTDSYTWDRWLDGTANITLKNGEGLFVGVPSGTPSLTFEAITSADAKTFEATNYIINKWYLLGFGYEITVSSIKTLYPGSVVWIMENGAYKKITDNTVIIPAGQGFWFKYK